MIKTTMVIVMIIIMRTVTIVPELVGIALHTSHFVLL